MVWDEDIILSYLTILMMSMMRAATVVVYTTDEIKADDEALLSADMCAQYVRSSARLRS